MTNTISQWLQSVADGRVAQALRFILNPIADRLSTHCVTSAGLAIKAGAGVLVKAVNITYALANGILQKIAANTDMAALSGTVTNAKFNVFAFYLDSAGTLTSTMGTEGATLAAVALPVPPQNKACLGWLVINPTGTGNFVGNTTALDDATVVPNAAYINFTGPVDPSILLG